MSCLPSTNHGDGSQGLAPTLVNGNPSHDAHPDDPKPTVIGLYGISGSGKSFLLKHLRQELGEADFSFFEGSDVIASQIPGGLEAFHKMDEQTKSDWRGRAINAIADVAAQKGQVAIVTGHFMFWCEGDGAGQPVCTSNDLKTYTHVIYLNVPVEVISKRRLDDKLRDRPAISAKHLCKWQESEISQMRQLCRQHGILFSVVSDQNTFIPKTLTLIRHFQQLTAAGSNLSRVRVRVDEILALPGWDQLETVLVMDGDKTLAADDTGELFWKAVTKGRPCSSPLGDLFSSPLGYSEAAFHQATLLYEEAVDDEHFEAICNTVASSVVMHPDFVSLLGLVVEQSHVGALVITCGLGRVWEKVLKRHGLSETVKVIGGGRISDGYVVTAAVKAAVISRLHTSHLYVWAFGDSPLDLPMLKAADEAIVVVGDERTRSSAMEKTLSNAMENENFQARQVLLPSRVSPRLDGDILPVIHLSDPGVIDSIMRRLPIEIVHATDKPAAKLLMAPMRDAAIAGPSLRKAHHRVGRYLATEFVSQVIGLEEYSIPHVQGHQTIGHRLQDEQRTLVVALMRGGEAMAFGVNAVFPHAMFVHAASAQDIKRHHLDDRSTVILVDSVVNSGETLIRFVTHLRNLDSRVRIVIVAGVVHVGVVTQTHALAKMMRRHAVSLVSLRLSENKFTGSGTTDTGNRLFNTTHLA